MLIMVGARELKSAVIPAVQILVLQDLSGKP